LTKERDDAWKQVQRLEAAAANVKGSPKGGGKGDGKGKGKGKSKGKDGGPPKYQHKKEDFASVAPGICWGFCAGHCVHGGPPACKFNHDKAEKEKWQKANPDKRINKGQAMAVTQPGPKGPKPAAGTTKPPASKAGEPKTTEWLLSKQRDGGNCQFWFWRGNCRDHTSGTCKCKHEDASKGVGKKKLEDARLKAGGSGAPAATPKSKGAGKGKSKKALAVQLDKAKAEQSAASKKVTEAAEALKLGCARVSDGLGSSYEYEDEGPWIEEVLEGDEEFDEWAVEEGVES
jgi:hypothetical protein